MLNPSVVNILKRSGVAVIPTDTIYGIVSRALNRKTVERIYQLKRRKPTKPFIILIDSMRDIERFGILLDQRARFICEQLWPGKVSIIFTHNDSKFRYLHRGSNTFAFRLPAKKSLRRIIKRTGPLVAPSANHEGEEPAKTIAEARAMFGNQVDAYQGGRLPKASKASTLVEYRDGRLMIKRQGAVNIPKRFL